MPYFNKQNSEIDEDLAGVYDPIPHPVIISKISGEIIFINNSCHDQHLQITDPQTGDSTLDFLHRKNPAKWLQHKKIIRETGRTKFRGKVAISPKSILIFDVFATKFHRGEQELLLTILNDVSQTELLKNNLKEQATHFEAVFNAIPSLIFVNDLNNKFIAANKALEEITNLSQNDIIGKNPAEITNDTEVVEQNWLDNLEVIETGLPKRNIISRFLPDKSRWFITDKIPYRNAAGKITGVIGFSTDITERKNVEDALVRSEKKFRQLFDTLPDGLIISNLDGRFSSANKAFLNMTGYSEAEIPDLNFREITPAESDVVEYEFIHQASNADIESKIFDKVYLNKEKKKQIPVRITCWMIKNSAGRPLQMGVYVKDISIELRAIELEKSLLAKEKAELQRNLQHQTQQLNMKVTQLLEKNELANNIINQLNKIESKDGDTGKRIKTIIFDLKNSTSENFWAEFETSFGLINQAFYERLIQAYPNISKNERKIIAFLRMNLSTKDIANITHQSIRSIEMARSRLRKKLKLRRSQNISTFLSNF
jgi:PAS domain S-box-containing protein